MHGARAELALFMRSPGLVALYNAILCIDGEVDWFVSRCRAKRAHINVGSVPNHSATRSAARASEAFAACEFEQGISLSLVVGARSRLVFL